MFTWLFIRKANFNRIKNILDKEGFVYSQEDINNLLKGNQKGTRYGNVVLGRKEGDRHEKRFLKIVLDGTWRTYKLFRRQVEVTKALSEDGKYNFPKLSVKSSYLKPPVPYAVFETREDGENFGFMHDKPKYYEMFSEEDISNLAKVIYGFHLSGHELDKKFFKHVQKISSRPGLYRKELNEHLERKITHKFSDGSVVKESVEKLLEKYLGITGIKSSILRSFDGNWRFVESSKAGNKKYLVHADMALDNIYKHENGGLEPLDFEWVGITDNPVVPIMYDYGNLRARAWSSPVFQEILDKAMLDEGVKQYGNREMVRAALDLGILRSGLMMSRFHMDYENTVKKDRRTEEDYFAMFPKTVASITSLLKSEN